MPSLLYQRRVLIHWWRSRMKCWCSTAVIPCMRLRVATKHGIPSLWPQFTYTNDNECSSKLIACYYHNGRLWPFVMGYWGMAAARHGQVDVFAEEMQNLVWLSQRNHTFAEFYELDGTFPQEKRRRQLIVERRWFAGSSVSRTVWTHVSSRQSRVSPYQT